MEFVSVFMYYELGSNSRLPENSSAIRYKSSLPGSVMQLPGPALRFFCKAPETVMGVAVNFRRNEGSYWLVRDAAWKGPEIGQNRGRFEER
jgi:hypothetical protein